MMRPERLARSWHLRDALVVRIPVRAGASQPIAPQHPFAFVRVVRDRVVQEGRASIGELPQAASTIVVFAAEDVLLLQREVPPLPERRLRQALPGLIEDATLADIASLHVAVAAADSTTRLVAVIDRALLAEWLDIFKRAQRPVTRAWCESLAVPFSASHWTLAVRPAQDGGGALLRVDQDTVLLLSGDAAADAPLLRHALARLAAPAAVLGFGQSEALAPYERLCQSLQLPLERAQANALAAYLEADHSAPALDLLQGEFAAGGLGSATLLRYRTVIVLAVIGLVIETIALGLNAHQLRAQKAALIATQSLILKRAFPDITTVLDAPVQMRQALDRLKQGAGAGGGSDFDTLLTHAGTLLANLPANACTEMHYDNRALNLSLHAPTLLTAEAQQSLKTAAERLGDTAIFTAASGDGMVSLHLSLKGRP